MTLDRPDFTNTEPAENIGPFPQWSDPKKIVAMDPLGHLAPWLYKDIIEKENGMKFHAKRVWHANINAVDIRPTIGEPNASNLLSSANHAEQSQEHTWKYVGSSFVKLKTNAK